MPKEGYDFYQTGINDRIRVENGDMSKKDIQKRQKDILEQYGPDALADYQNGYNNGYASTLPEYNSNPFLNQPIRPDENGMYGGIAVPSNGKGRK